MVTLDGSSQPLLAYISKAHSYLTTTTIPYLPFSIFAVIHGTRIACAYRGAARKGGYDDRIGWIQAAIVPCVLIFGGTTVTGALLGIIPGWLISPVPLATYALIPLAVAKSPILPFLLSLPHYPREVAFSCVDGFSRIVGITTFGVDTVLSHPNPALRNSPWSMIAVATIAGGGGGLIVPSFRGFHADWTFQTPPWVKEGPAIDVWGATVIGYVYSTLIDAHPFFRILPASILENVPFLKYFIHLPKNYLNAAGAQPLLPNNEAKIACSLLLASMLSIKVLLPLLSLPTKSAKKTPTTAVAPKKSTPVTLKEKKTQ
ncbi:hypothetical protein T439DRAFT_316530 [Meredithblackwellia eburnea MCA 4105]